MNQTTTDAPLSADQHRQAANAPTATPHGVHSAIVSSIPTLLVLALLGGLAWWGHHHDWRIPAFSDLTGTAPVNGEVWCDAHGVPEADCIACRPELMPKGQLFGWCAEHGVHECVLHHPQLAQLSRNPEAGQSEIDQYPVNEADLERAARAIEVYPRTKNDPGCTMHLRRIQFPSIETVDDAGLDIALVVQGPVRETIKTTGEIVYDPTRVARVSSRLNGTIWRVEKNTGDRVREGDLLALVDAVETGRLKSQLLSALNRLALDTSTLERMTRLGGTVIPLKEIEQAQSARAQSEFEVDSAIEALANLGLPVNKDDILKRSAADVRREIRFLGIPAPLAAELEQSSATANLIPVFAPRGGIVVERNAVAGEVIETGEELFVVADTGVMWLMLNVRLEEAARVALGQTIDFRPDGSDQKFTGLVTWISTATDAQTRTIAVRAELPNANGALRNETFGSGEILLREEPDAILAPAEAIHWEGCCHVAFVRDKDWFKDGSYKVFHTRSVRPGAAAGEQVEIIAGLLPGEVIVTRGSGLLRAELLKGNLGAG